jgi:hypothetical protein
MDNGLILLNTQDAFEHVRFDWYFAGQPLSWIAIIATIILVITGVICIIYGYEELEDGALGFGIVCIIIAIGIMIFTLVHEVNKTYPLYQVTITEKTNMKEFYDKYDVIKQDGMIFTIRDKDYKEQDYE